MIVEEINEHQATGFSILERIGPDICDWISSDKWKWTVAAGTSFSSVNVFPNKSSVSADKTNLSAVRIWNGIQLIFSLKCERTKSITSRDFSYTLKVP